MLTCEDVELVDEVAESEDDNEEGHNGAQRCFECPMALRGVLLFSFDGELEALSVNINGDQLLK